MLDDVTTLAEFFSIMDIPDERMDELESTASVADLRAKLAKQFDGLRWSAVWDAVSGQLEKLLDIRFLDILAGAWSKYDELQKYCDVSQFPPEDTHLVPLIEHAIASTHRPSVEVEIGEGFKEQVPFEITLMLKLNGMLVQIRGGRILKIYTGRCQASGSVTCSGITLLEKETSEVQLPGMFDLGEGVAIGCT